VVAGIVPELGSVALTRLHLDGRVDLLSDPAGFATGAAGGGTVVVAQHVACEPVVTTTVYAAGTKVGELTSRAERSPLTPNARTLRIVGPTGQE
jgi:hypothetical protein